MARLCFLDICYMMMLMPTTVSSILVLGFALLVHIYEIDIYELMIMLLFIVSNMTSIYVVADSIIVLGIIIITKVLIYLTQTSYHQLQNDGFKGIAKEVKLMHNLLSLEDLDRSCREMLLCDVIRQHTSVVLFKLQGRICL